MIEHSQTISNYAIVILMGVLIILLLVNIIRFNINVEEIISSGENVTEITDIADIKKRMEYHGCLVCWKDSAGVWWFRRDDQLCELHSLK